MKKQKFKEADSKKKSKWAAKFSPAEARRVPRAGFNNRNNALQYNNNHNNNDNNGDDDDSSSHTNFHRVLGHGGHGQQFGLPASSPSSLRTSIQDVEDSDQTMIDVYGHDHITSISQKAKKKRFANKIVEPEAFHKFFTGRVGCYCTCQKFKKELRSYLKQNYELERFREVFHFKTQDRSMPRKFLSNGNSSLLFNSNCQTHVSLST